MLIYVFLVQDQLIHLRSPLELLLFDVGILFNDLLMANPLTVFHNMNSDLTHVATLRIKSYVNSVIYSK